MSGDTNIDILRNQFLADFGIVHQTQRKRKYHTTKSAIVGSNKWAFTLRSVRAPADLQWVALHSDMVSSASIQASMANQMATTRAMVALSVAAINGVPLFQMMGVKVDDAEYANVSDPLNPPTRIRLAAAEIFLGQIRSAEFGQVIVEFVQDEYDTHLDDTPVILPKPDARPDHLFKCGACHFDWIFGHEKMERLEATMAERGGLACPACGEMTPEVQAKEEEKGPFSPPGGGS